MKNCIYIIESISTGRIYIGSAKTPVSRKSLHLRTLLKGKHHNAKLQNHYNKYGSSDLVFKILEGNLPKDDLIIIEQRYIDLFNPYFNICKVAGSAAGRAHSQQTKQKIRASLLGRKRTQEARDSISQATKGIKKKPFTDAHRINISKGTVGIRKPPQSKEHIEKRVKKMLGNQWNKGKPNRNVQIVQIRKGEIIKEYKSIKLAAQDLKMTSSNIIHALKGRKKQPKEYEWRYKKDFISHDQTALV